MSDENENVFDSEKDTVHVHDLDSPGAGIGQNTVPLKPFLKDKTIDTVFSCYKV